MGSIPSFKLGGLHPSSFQMCEKYCTLSLFAVHVFHLDCSLSFSPRKIFLSVSLCSYRSRRSRCSRFMILKGSVHNKSNREMRKTAKVCVFCFSSFASFASFAVHVFYLECSLSFSPQKFVLVCFSMFASFAVRDSKTECPLYFKPRNTRKSRTKNGVSVVAPKRFEEESN